MTALASVSLLARPRLALPVLRWPVLTVIVLTAGTLVVFPFLEAATTVVHFYPGGEGIRSAFNPLGVAEELTQACLAILLGATLLMVLIRPLMAARRRRIVPPAT